MFFFFLNTVMHFVVLYFDAIENSKNKTVQKFACLSETEEYYTCQLSSMDNIYIKWLKYYLLA